MDGLHWADLLVLLGLGLLIFGPKRLPQIGASAGEALRALRRALREDTPSGPRHDYADPEYDVHEATTSTSTATTPSAPHSATETAGGVNDTAGRKAERHISQDGDTQP